MNTTTLDYILNETKTLLAIDSPTGFTAGAAAWVLDRFAALGYPTRQTAKGGVLIDLGGEDGENALVRVALDTGRTHQIRVQFSSRGMPLWGDGKYGSERKNKSFGETEGQALYSYKLRFDFPTDAGILNYLRGKEFEVTDIDFVNKYFG